MILLHLICFGKTLAETCCFCKPVVSARTV